MKRLLLVPLSVALVAACGKPGTSEATSPASSATPPAKAAPDSDPEPAETKKTPEAEKTPEKKKDLTGCEARFEEFDKVLVGATYTCKKDADCGCFDVGVSRTPGSECGGVVEKTIAKKLDTIAKAAKKESCATSAMCEAWTCDPACEDGQCRKSPSGKKK